LRIILLASQDNGYFPFNQKLRNSRNAGNFLEKFQENLKIKFSKCKPFNQRFWKIHEENQMERTFPHSKIWVYLTRLSSFLEILENAVPLEFPKIETGIFRQMESAQYLLEKKSFT